MSNIDIINELNNSLFEMANLSSKRTGLSVSIWSDGDGIHRQVKHNIPRIKIGKRGLFSILVSIEEHPRILVKSRNISQSDLLSASEAIDYISRNYDLFLKHYNSTDEEYDDDDLKEDLRKRGEYK